MGKIVMNLVGRNGIPTDVCEGNPNISNDKLILQNGRFKRGFYSYLTKKWLWIEEFKNAIDGMDDDGELIWFDIDKK